MGSLHARVVTQSTGADLAFVVDADDAVSDDLARRIDSTPAPLDADLESVDAVIVASPTDTHAEWATRAIEAGRPVLIEKPVSEDLEETRAVLRAAEAAGVPVMCGLLERFNPAVRTAMDMVENPVHVTSTRHSHYLKRIATGVTHDLIIHDVDVVLRLAGELPTDVQGLFAKAHPRSTAEDVAEVRLKFASGLVAALSASRVSQRKIRLLTIAELDRLIEVDLVRQDVTVYRHVESDFVEGRIGGGYREKTAIEIPVIQNPKEPLVSQLEHFLDLIEGRVDQDAERDSILPTHQVVDAARGRDV
jgi:predicted dehydrogenase